MSEWIDISLLNPMSGLIVIGYGEYRDQDGFSPAFMRWSNGWKVGGMPFYPTHWMPLPSNPKPLKGG